MYDIFYVANYIIFRCYKLELEITQDVLQNLLFLVQKEFITAYNHKCFISDFYALGTGPLNLGINREYFSYHTRNLPTPTYSDFYFPKQDQYVIDSIISDYAEYGPEKIKFEARSDGSYLEAKAKSSKDQKEIYVIVF